MIVKSSVIKVSCISLLFLFILNFLNIFINMDFIALLSFFLLLLYFYKSNRQILIKYMFMIVMFSYHIFSVFVAENTSCYFHNLLKESYHSGAFVPLLTSYFLMFIILFILEANKKSKILTIQSKSKNSYKINLGKITLSEKKRVKIITLMLLILTLIILIRIGKNGFYSMNGIDRFAYRKQMFTGFDEKFYTYISWFLPIPLMGINLKMKKTSFLFFSLYCIYLIMVGDKFGSLFIAFYIFMLVSWATREISKKVIRKVTILVFLVVAILMTFISFQVVYERGSWEEVPVYFSNRMIGGQSDLWWGVYTQEKNNGWRISELGDELSAIVKQPDNMMDYNFGIYKMMRVTAPGWVVDNYLSRGVRFAASSQASLFYYFKYTGLYLGSVLIAFLYFFTVNLAIRAYKKNDIIRAIIYTMLLSKVIQLTTMSDISMLGNTTTIAGMVILITLWLFEKKKYKNDFKEINTI